MNTAISAKTLAMYFLFALILVGGIAWFLIGSGSNLVAPSLPAGYQKDFASKTASLKSSDSRIASIDPLTSQYPDLMNVLLSGSVDDHTARAIAQECYNGFVMTRAPYFSDGKAQVCRVTVYDDTSHQVAVADQSGTKN